LVKKEHAVAALIVGGVVVTVVAIGLTKRAAAQAPPTPTPIPPPTLPAEGPAPAPAPVPAAPAPIQGALSYAQLGLTPKVGDSILILVGIAKGVQGVISNILANGNVQIQGDSNQWSPSEVAPIQTTTITQPAVLPIAPSGDFQQTLCYVPGYGDRYPFTCAQLQSISIGYRKTLSATVAVYALGPKTTIGGEGNRLQLAIINAKGETVYSGGCEFCNDPPGYGTYYIYGSTEHPLYAALRNGRYCAVGQTFTVPGDQSNIDTHGMYCEASPISFDSGTYTILLSQLGTLVARKTVTIPVMHGRREP